MEPRSRTMKYITYVGSYTAEDHPEGIHILESDAETGAIRMCGALDTFESPIYMALNRDCTRLYTVMGRPSFGPSKRNGGIAALAVKGDGLEVVNEIRTGWTIPCHVSLDPAERTLVYAEYSCGTAGYANILGDGSLDPSCAAPAPESLNPLCQVKHVGDGPNKPRQDSAHAHCSVVTPDGRYQLVVDLALDRVVAYDFANRAQGMKEVPSASIDTRAIAPGAGPRHIVFHPNGRLAFVVFELGNIVASFRYTGEGFAFIEKHDLLPDGAGESSKAAAIRLSEDGTQVLCSNRGHDSISVFNADPDTGRMERINVARLGGKFPRDFQFMPGGKFVIAGLKESWRVASYAYDAATGAFEEAARIDGIYRPLFFAFKTR